MSSPPLPFQQSKQKAKQVLILYSKLLGLQQTCWGQVFLFEKTYCFEAFNKKLRMKDLFEIRLDDLIYLVLLAGLMIMFNLLSNDTSHQLWKAYKVFCLILFLKSMICLFVKPGVKYLFLLIFSIIVPVMMNGLFSKWISMDPTQSLQMYDYLGYLSMPIAYFFTILVYPLKSYIQKSIGSLYSYLYGLSVICLLGLWPTYSLLSQMTITGSITLSIIYNNRPLVISFIVIIVFSFYLIVHNTFFEGDKEKLYEILRKLFTNEQINKAIEEMQQQDMKQYEWFNVSSRIMSFIVLSTTLAIEIFIFFNTVNDSTSITKSTSLMIFALLFLILGTFYIIVPISNKVAVPIFAIISLTPAPLSFFYVQYFSYWEYICTIFSIPYIILFWSVIRHINEYKPLMQNKILAVMYVFIHVPVMVFVMDVLDYFGSGNGIGPVGYVAIIIVALTIFIAALLSIVMFCMRLCGMNTQSTKNTTQLDFNYEEPLDYQPYKKLNTFTLQWLAELNLLDIGTFLNIFFYLVCNTISFYSLNQLIHNYSSTYFFSSSIYELTYAQFFILLIFMVYCHYFMSTNNDNWDFWMLTAWVVIGIVLVALSYVLSLVPVTFRLIGGFCLVMFVISIGFEFIKDGNKKIISFISPVLIIALWITIIIPYAIGIPTASIYADQTDFGYFVYECILASALLLIVLVGVVSMIFNILMGKFQQQKRYKYVIQDVKQFFDEEGVESNDEILHVFHEAYECRDKKYIFYLKNGFPLNVVKDEEHDTHKIVTYDNYIRGKTTQVGIKNEKKQQETDCCWNCLTFFCGADDDQIKKKVKNAIQKNLINEEQAQTLFPSENLDQMNQMLRMRMAQRQPPKPVRVRSQDVNSTKSLLLHSVTQIPRRLGPQYTLLKLEKSRILALQIWSSIFHFISNPDKGEPMIIYNDFMKFCQLSNLKLSQEQTEELFNKYAKSTWGDTVGMKEEEFATAMEHVAQEIYKQVVKDEKQRIMVLLVDRVYYNMARYQEFNQMRRDQANHHEFNIHRCGFVNSLKLYKQASAQHQQELSHLIHFYKKQKFHMDEPRKQFEPKSSKKKLNKRNESTLEQNYQDEDESKKSCKRSIYDKYISCKNSCSNVVPIQETKIIKREKIKPWSYLAVESAKILHRKELLWQDQHQAKQYEFRCILNNIFMAVFKLADVYTYLQLTLKDPQVKWYDSAQFSFLYIDYKYQLYLCLALAFITVPLGVKGISFIAEDRLGLTEARVPAGFPHPMFFYTVIYKLLILSLFVTISSTFLVTFSCTWTQTAPYKLYTDNSIECLSFEHNIYMILSLIFLIIYFPLSSYTFPNFQFSEKRLDLKFRPSYLVLYFQINFVLVANKVLLSPASSSSATVEIAFICINIVSLLFLSLVCLKMKPCLIEWFNWIEFLSIFIGFIWNVGGLALYLTKQWTLCVILFGGITIIAIAIVVIIIKRVYFSSSVTVNAVDQDQVKQLQLARKYNHSKNKLLIAQNKASSIDIQKYNPTILTQQNITANNPSIFNSKPTNSKQPTVIVEDLLSDVESNQTSANNNKYSVSDIEQRRPKNNKN